MSLEKQSIDGCSLDDQRAAIAAFADARGIKIVAFEVDAGESAATLDRPALGRALALLRARKVDAMIVTRLDRVSRAVRDIDQLVQTVFSGRKARALIAVREQIDTSTPSGRGMINIMASVAQMAREDSASRTSAAMQHLRASGKFTGGACRYGYRLADDGETLEAVESEQAAIRAARELRSRGLSLRDVAAALDERGMRARSGRAFAPKVIATLVAA